MLGGCPAAGGKGENLLRARSFKLRHPRTTFIFFTVDFLREAGIWRLKQKDDPYNRHDQYLLEFQFLRMKGVFLYTHE